MPGTRARSDQPPSSGDRTQPISWVERVAFAGVGFVGAYALVRVITSEPIPAVALLAIYLASLLAFGAVLIATLRAGRDTTIPLLALLAATWLGPLAAFGALALSLRRPAGGSPGPLLEAWYDRISRAAAVGADERLSLTVASGRTLNLAGPLPASFPSLMDGGLMADRQMILGHIARNFHHAYTDTLAAALASSEPAVRVQAAAVAAHLAPELRRRLVMALERAGRADLSQLERLHLVDELGALARSGLLDANERLRTEAEIGRLGDAIVGDLEGSWRDPRSDDEQLIWAEVEPAFEQLLLARGRTDALRQFRLRRRIKARHPAARLRRVRPAQPRRAAR